MEFFKSQFDKLLITALVLVFAGLSIHIIHDISDAKLIDWVTNAFSALLGALLGLITGSAMRGNSRREDK
jgi:hypothetical protein